MSSLDENRGIRSTLLDPLFQINQDLLEAVKMGAHRAHRGTSLPLLKEEMYPSLGCIHTLHAHRGTSQPLLKEEMYPSLGCIHTLHATQYHAFYC